MAQGSTSNCLDGDIATMTSLVHQVLPGGWKPELAEFICNRAPFGPLTSAWARALPGERVPETLELQRTGREMSWLLAGLPESYVPILDGLDPTAQYYARFRADGTMRIINMVILENGNVLFLMEDEGA